jgi:hypothetical protein
LIFFFFYNCAILRLLNASDRSILIRVQKGFRR